VCRQHAFQTFGAVASAIPRALLLAAQLQVARRRIDEGGCREAEGMRPGADRIVPVERTLFLAEHPHAPSFSNSVSQASHNGTQRKPRNGTWLRMRALARLAGQSLGQPLPHQRAWASDKSLGGHQAECGTPDGHGWAAGTRRSSNNSGGGSSITFITPNFGTPSCHRPTNS
jgi:hypothetical protein